MQFVFVVLMTNVLTMKQVSNHLFDTCTNVTVVSVNCNLGNYDKSVRRFPFIT